MPRMVPNVLHYIKVTIARKYVIFDFYFPILDWRFMGMTSSQPFQARSREAVTLNGNLY